MSLNGVSATVSSDGSRILLTNKQQKVIQELILTQATPAHRSFIISTWLKSYKHSAKKQGYGAFYEESEPAIAESLWVDCLVATDSDGFTVYGWVCIRGDCLYHSYVVPELRRIGVFGAMASGMGGYKSYARRWPYGAKCPVNPYALGVGGG